jgi:hypothetical protein
MRPCTWALYLLKRLDASKSFLTALNRCGGAEEGCG